MQDNEQFTKVFYFEHERQPINARVLLKHGGLLVLTFITATIAGTLYPFGSHGIFTGDDPQTWTELFQFLLLLPGQYVLTLVNAASSLLTDTSVLAHGLSFSLSLLFILVCHEMGHYIACRIYRVDATLPFFIPTPPMIGPAGTFGAFIRILSPMPSRKAVFDIGVAGPIAGFIALIPIAVIGVMTRVPAPPEAVANYSGITFSDPILIQIIAAAAGVDLSASYGNAFFYAAWIGLLVTALNLIPSGQLDGGHAIYAVFGKRVHYWTGRIAFFVMAALSIQGMVYYSSPSGFLIAVLLGIMMRIPHPHPWDESPLDAKRKLIAVCILAIFAVSFLPFPIKIT
ncbi:MAG: site-2 protease family protein [Acidobacteria bacterium]|nr:site-2 protease family protein [Acidobacteriota bacterium]